MNDSFPTTFISTAEEEHWDLPVARWLKKELLHRSVHAFLLHDDSSLGTNLESLWQTEIAQRDSFLLLWSPDALDRPRVIAEFRHAKQIQKPRMAVLFPFKYETDIGGNAHRYVDPPPGWDPNEKWERLVGLQFTKQAQIFAPPTRGSVQLRRGGEEMVDRLAAWIKAASAGKSLTSVRTSSVR